MNVRRPALLPFALVSVGFFLGFVSLLVAAPARGEDPARSNRGQVFTATGTPPERIAAPSDDAEVRGAFIHGTDDRERLRDTHEFPFSAFVFLQTYDDWGFELWSCSGVLIGPDAVLTAAHCLWDATGGFVNNIAVVPGKDGGHEPFGYEWASSWWVPNGWINSGGGQSGFDWGVIRMGSSALAGQSGYLGISVLTDETLLRDDIGPAIVGYPGDKPEGTLWGAMVDSFLWVDAFELFYDIDTYSGQSGAPILLLGDTEFLGSIVGIHTRGGPLGNAGIRIDHEVLANLGAGCVQMGCTFDYYIEEDTPAPPTATPTSTATPTTAAATATATSPVSATPTVAVPSERGSFVVLAPGVVSNAAGNYVEPTGGPAPASPTPLATPTRTATPTPVTSTPMATATATPTQVPPTPTAVSTRVVVPVTPTPPTGPGSGILATIDGWYAQVEDFADQHLAIVGAAQGGFLTYSNAAGQLDALADEAFAFGEAISGSRSARAAWPTSCQYAADWTGLSAGWQGLVSGYWSLLYYQWPYGDYYADIENAMDQLYIARTNAIEGRYYCATGGQANTMQTLPLPQ